MEETQFRVMERVRLRARGVRWSIWVGRRVGKPRAEPQAPQGF